MTSSIASQTRKRASLCGAAHLIADGARGLSDADEEVRHAEERVAKSAGPAPIEEAATARARCLDVLTRARRALGDDASGADSLLAELSAAGGWDPARCDERGVVVTLRGGVRGGAEVTPEATAKMKELGRVAAAHPTFAVQLVVHDAQTPAPQDPTDRKRAQAAAQALLAGGAGASRVRQELVGARIPVVEPSDPTTRGRNERLDVVFVNSDH